MACLPWSRDPEIPYHKVSMPAALESSRGGAAVHDVSIYSYAPFTFALSEHWRILATSRFMCMDLRTLLSS